MSFDPGLKRKSLPSSSRSKREGLDEDASFEDDAKTIQGDENNSDGEENEEGAQGSFQSTEEVIVRWATDDAAFGNSSLQIPSSLHSSKDQKVADFPIRGRALESNLSVQVGSSEIKSEDEAVELGLKWECELKEPSYRGLEDYAHLQ